MKQRRVVLLPLIIALFLSLIPSVRAEAMGSCDYAGEQHARHRAKAYDGQNRSPASYMSAAQNFLFAANLTNGCETARGSLISAINMASAGIAFSEARHYDIALVELRLSQTMYTMVVSIYPDVAEDAKNGYDADQGMIDAIQKVQEAGG